ncbi:non-ribosomal peptide synthetase [Breoghania sp. L-A4]|uniref:non-ribosomal peptide synthetase n=1 Tax=Breoghania sp. L-A4 TaxID=2304600 RepID=UPI0013C2F24E|nr:non-ribosomal peptide synthetase [Breoghania sp. L-A4]
MREVFSAKVLDIVGQSLKVDGAAVDLETPLADYGLDSIAVTALVDDLNRQTGAKLNPTLFFEARSLHTIVTHALDAWPGEIAKALDWTLAAPSLTKPAEPAQALQMPPAALITETPRPQIARDTADPIAIVGLDLRFPGADDADTLWRVLLDGASQVGEVPRERWDWRAQPDGPQQALRWGGFIKGIDRFDAGFFGIAPLEADAMDPQQRLLLHSAWRAIESAGHGPRTLAGSRTGVFIGCAGYDYMTLLNRSQAAPQGWNATGVAPSLMANRLSYALDLRGPSESVDTACSSSLVALDRAMKALRAGACEAAIVGASSAMLAPDLHTAFARAGLLSPSGRCHAFDASADGYTRGEGVAALYLKPLSQARRDGDPVLGLVLGSAVNHGGHGTSLTAPNAQAQADVLRAAWADAGIAPAEIGYIEAHGTGTALGDPVEIRGLTAALADCASEPGSIAVSTVKSRLGHLEAAAGLAGVIAALLAVRHGIRPGNPQILERNPLIVLKDTALALPREASTWPQRERRIAGISSFGFGGTNAHVVIAAADEDGERTNSGGDRPALIVLSARTDADLKARAADLAAWIAKQALPAAQVTDDTSTELAALIAARLGLAPDAVSMDETLAELGFDAPLLRTLGQALSDRFGHAASRTPLSVDTTPAQIARSLAPGMETAEPGTAATLADLAYTLQAGRDAMAHRLAFVATSLDEVRATLDAFTVSGNVSDICQGITDKQKQGAAKLFAREAGQALIAQAAADGALEDLAALWCEGATIPWAVLWDKNALPRRLALPAYRFAGERHWLAGAAPESAAPLTILCPGWQKTSLPGVVDFVLADSTGPWPNDQPLVIRLDETSDPQAGIARLASNMRAALESGPLRLAIIIPGHAPDRAALAEAIAGLIKAWARETPSLRAIAAFGDDGRMGSLAAAIETLPAGSLIRLRGGDAEIQVLRETQPPANALDIKGRVFLITGGNGQIGRLLVAHLLDQGALGIITMSRTAAPSDDARVMAFAGDCTRPDDVAAAVRLARDAFGRIDTIIHAAGVLSDGLMQGDGLARMPAVLAPKIGGLDALLAEGVPVVAFSSLAGWLGSPSQAAYAAANRYLDGYAAALGPERLRTLAWPLWDEADAATPQARLAMKRELGLEPLATRQAWDILASTTGPVSVVVPAGDDAPVMALLTAAGAAVPVSSASGSARELIAEALGLQAPPPGDARLGEIGFTSLTAVRLASDLRTRCGLDWPLKRFFEHDSVEGLAGALDVALDEVRDGASMRDDARPPAPILHIAPAPARTECALSSGQRDLLLHQLVTPRSYAYNLPVLFRLDPALETGALRDALDQFVRRHPLLRDTYRRDGDTLLRVPGDDTTLALEELTAPDGDDAAQTAWLRDLARRSFRLDRDAPLRAMLITGLNDAPRALLLTLHHIAVDGLSLAILQRDLDALIARKRLAALDDAYAAFVEEQAGFRGSDEGQNMLAWWGETLKDPLTPLDLPTLVRPPRDRANPQGSHRTATITADTATALKSRWVSGGTTMAAVTLAAWAAVLGRFAPTGPVRLMTPVANRPDRRFSDTVGLFMNPVLVNVVVPESGCFSDLLANAAGSLQDAIEHARTPLADVMALLARDGKPPALHEAAHAGFLYQDWHGVSEGPLTRLDTLHHEGDFILALEVIDTAEGLRLLLKHDEAFVDAETAEWLLQKTAKLLETLIKEDPELAALDAAEAADQTRIAAWNAATRDTIRHMSVSERLRQHAAATPNRPAVISGTDTWDYVRADRHADRVANALHAAGVTTNDIVGIRMDRGIALPSVLIGILRAGAAYLPLDPAFPQARVAYMLEDSGARFLIDLTDDPLSAPGLTVIRPQTIADSPEMPVDTRQAGALAYVLYTSGSTGKPKGVRIPRTALDNFLTSMAIRPGLDADDRMLALTTVSFDISGLELLLPLTVGASVEIVSAAQARDARALRECLESGAITIAQATPATWRMVLAAGWTGGGALKRLLIGGEALPADLAETLAGLVPEVWNMYGPTETTIWSACGRVEPGRRITAGLPIANTSLHVLDEALNSRAIGATGELAIGGDGLAEGYQGLAELTAERFVDIADETGARTRVYRTGDLARLLADGSLEILGRIDAQAKLRGFRIEPGEIEATIMRGFNCHDCAVLVRASDGGLDELVAFCVAGASPMPPIPERMTALAGWLPDHMVPTRWVDLETLPRTLNDKTDRKALSALPLEPQMAQPASISQTDAIRRSPPVDATIRLAIAAITGQTAATLDETLPLTLFGLDSLRVVRLAEDLGEALGLDVTPTDVFNAGTIKGLTNELTGRMPATTPRLAAPAIRDQTQTRETDIAVIGLSGRFPDAQDPDALWRNLMAGRTSFKPVSRDRWDVDSVFDARRNQPGRTYSRVAALLDDIAGFDPAAFAMTEQEAQSTDPQQRLFLLESLRALRDAGLDPAVLAGSACGVFAGATFGDYHRLLEASGRMDAFAMAGNSPSLIPARLAYHLDLKGPATAVDTACSASLVAVHDACRALIQGEASMAVAGGVYLMTTSLAQVLSAGANVLSAEEVCRPFDARGDGIVLGEAVAALVLKPLGTAIADGDPIRAVIKGTAINQDGRTAGITAPSAPSQAAVIAQALANAGVDPDTIGYVEAHGTGTRLGDPIEIDGLRRAYGDETTTPKLLGSIKANIGHAYQAAGIAGLVKAILCLENGLVPPQPGLETINPLLKLERTAFRVPLEATDLKGAAGVPLRAGVSSFGFSGTNAHVVLEAWPECAPRPQQDHVATGQRCWVDPTPQAPASPVAIVTRSDDTVSVTAPMRRRKSARNWPHSAALRPRPLPATRRWTSISGLIPSS